MKKTFFIILFFCTFFASYSQSFLGEWQGKLKLGINNLTIVFNLTENEGDYKATMDSPDQGAKGLMVDKVVVNGDSLQIEIFRLGVLYKGRQNSDTLISGLFSQGGMSFPLELKKGKVLSLRPQEPISPFPYNSDDIYINVPDEDRVIAGTLTYPKEGSVFPTVILITGSGPQNRNQEIFGHKPFLVLADYLTKNGIAVFRYDDRGVGGSTGNFSSATTEDFMHDALYVYNYLQTHSEVDKHKIGLLGHSEGGKIAFMAAARNQKIPFIVSMAGDALRGDSTLIIQNRMLLKPMLGETKVVDDYCKALKDVFTLKAKFSEYKMKNVNDELDTLLAEKYQSIPENLKANLKTILNLNNVWMDYYIQYDPAPDLLKITCPVLAVNGDKDIQVDADANLDQIKRLLESSGNKYCTTIKYENLNHLLQECTTGSVVEYNQIQQTISPKVLNDVTLWIKSITR